VKQANGQPDENEIAGTHCNLGRGLGNPNGIHKTRRSGDIESPRNAMNKLTVIVMAFAILALGNDRLMADLSDGLVAYYPLNGNANDTSGNGLKGTLFNATFGPGRNGQGLITTGATNSYIEVQPNSLLSPSNAVTVSCWVNVTGFPNSYSCLLYKSAATPTSNGFSDRAYSLWIRSDGGIHFNSTPSGASSQIVCNSPAGGIQITNWFNVVGVVDVANHVMKIYINGNLVASTPYVGSSIETGDFPLRLGGPFVTGGDQCGLNGILDDVRIYNRALSDAEIAQIDYSPPPELIGIQFVQAGPALGSNDEAGVIPQGNFNAVQVNNSAGTQGTTAPLLDSNGNTTGVTLTHASNDGYNSNTSTGNPNGILLHGEDKTGPPGHSSGPGMTSTYTFNNVPNGTYNLIAYIENDYPGVSASITVGSSTYYVVDESTTGTPAFVNASGTDPDNPVTGNYVEFLNVSPSSGNQLAVTYTSIAGGNVTASINGFQLEGTASAPSIVTPLPQSVSIVSGSSETFTVQANGTPPLQYSWYKGGILLATATSASFTLNDAVLASGGTYSVTVSNAFGSASSSTSLLVLSDLGVFSAPSQPTYISVEPRLPNKDSLIVITHGWNWAVYPDISWISDLQEEINTYLTSAGETNWQVEAINWSADANGNFYPNGSYTGISPSPEQAAENGASWGTSLGRQWASQGWKRIHFIAHSAGASLIDAAVQAIVLSGSDNPIQGNPGHIEIQETFLDPYLGVGHARSNLYGISADWADNYFACDDTSLATGGPMQHAYSFDVTWLDPNAVVILNHSIGANGQDIISPIALSSHGWPINFYENTVTAITSGTAGFPLSQEADGWVNALALGDNSVPVILGGTATFAMPDPATADTVSLSTAPYLQSSAGTVTVSESGMLMSSPASVSSNVSEQAAVAAVSASPLSTGSTWISFALTGTSATNVVSFDVNFQPGSSGQGLLSVYWNGAQVGTIDEANTFSGIQQHSYTVTPSGNSQGNILSFRLDDFGSAASVVSITNIQTGFEGYGTTLTLGIKAAGSGQMMLNVTGQLGGQYFIETSNDLSNWSPMAGVSLQSGTSAEVIDPDAGNYMQRFYEAVGP